ncbi:MAG TPA: hypothetical protein VG757_09645 [Devosia sp.]|jgi:hypothetical protein|nr:hypothetical protein [Devosia sp.]
MGVMGQLAERRNGTVAFARQVNWRGRSGRFYALTPERLDAFGLASGDLYLLALGGNVLWVGNANDVVNDAQSRSRFRLALDCADRAFTVDAPPDDLTRMTLVWDLEGAEPVTGLSAA